MTTSPEALLAFWLDELGPTRWWVADPAVDEACRRYQSDMEAAVNGALDEWMNHAEGALALILLLDQFPRNLYRDDPRAFAADPAALGHARTAVAHNLDLEIDEPLRMFFYLPFEHSEALADQAMCLSLFQARTTLDEQTLRAVQGHYDVIEQFGRFPYRNTVLGRSSTPEEIAYLNDPSAYRPGQKP